MVVLFAGAGIAGAISVHPTATAVVLYCGGVVLAVLLGFYIFHYFFLENSVQEMEEILIFGAKQTEMHGHTETPEKSGQTHTETPEKFGQTQNKTRDE
jgi:hypothetical protein